MSRRTRSARALGAPLAAVVATATLLALAPLAPATAEDLLLRDGVGDMWRGGAVGPTEPAPGQRNGDETRALVRNRAHAVVVRQRFAELRRVGAYAQYTVRLQTGARLTRDVVVEADPHSWKGQVHVFRRDGSLVGSCGARHAIDYAANTVTVVVPSACLHHPRLVRARMTEVRANRDGEYLTDNPHGDRDHPTSWTRWVRRG